MSSLEENRKAAADFFGIKKMNLPSIALLH